MILDIVVANGDYLLLNGAQINGPIDYPVPKFFTPGTLNVTFVSDASQVATGFNLAYACHGKPVMVAMVILSSVTIVHRQLSQGNSTVGYTGLQCQAIPQGIKFDSLEHRC